MQSIEHPLTGRQQCGEPRRARGGGRAADGPGAFSARRWLFGLLAALQRPFAVLGAAQLPDALAGQSACLDDLGLRPAGIRGFPDRVDELGVRGLAAGFCATV